MLNGRYFSERDLAFVEGINEELLGDVIQTQVTLFKACADATKLNIYGESSPKEGKQFYPGIKITCLIERADISTEVDDFGPDRRQNVVFRFLQKELEQIDFFPQNGDLVLFNARYHQIDDVVQEQLLGGIAQKSFSLIVNTHYSRLSAVDIVQRQS